MGLSNNLISQFTRTIVDEQETSRESTVYGTSVIVDGVTWVKLDGSDLLTPVSTTADVKDGERVTVMIKDHTAVITGNTTSPSASSTDLKKTNDDIVEFKSVTTDRLVAGEAIISELQVDNLDIKDRLTATEANISYLEAEKLSAEVAELTYATIEDLEATNAEIYNLSATYATIEHLEANYAKIESLDATYANIDFANIGEAAIEKLFAGTGLIENLVVDDQQITGDLAAVRIAGDLITAGTLKADRLIIQGEDGLYYQLNIDALGETSTEVVEEDLQNGLHGSAIIAETITAEKIAVSELAAFNATIGGFNMTDESLYSGVKESVDNTTQGVYLGADGQIAIGDATNYLKYYKNDDEEYVLQIAAESVLFGASGKSVATAIDDVSGATDDLGSRLDTAESDIGTIEGQVNDLVNRTEYINMGVYVNENGDEEPCIELGEGDSDFKMLITNTRILFKEGSNTPAYVTNNALNINKAVIEEELQQGSFVWKIRANGNLGLIWKEG